MTDKKLEFKHAHITGQAMRDHWGPIVDRIAAETADWRDEWIYDLITENERLREALHTPLAFIEALHENDPDDQIADNGMTVLDGLKQQAPSVIKTIRAALGETK